MSDEQIGQHLEHVVRAELAILYPRVASLEGLKEAISGWVHSPWVLLRLLWGLVLVWLAAPPPLEAQAALETLHRTAEAGNAEAQYELGRAYEMGEGVSEDDAEAVRWYRMAAEQGEALAQFNLGLMYANGRGVLKDEAEAVRWFRLAAEQGLALAQFNLGLMYANGRGVLKDEAEPPRVHRRLGELSVVSSA